MLGRYNIKKKFYLYYLYKGNSWMIKKKLTLSLKIVVYHYGDETILST